MPTSIGKQAVVVGAGIGGLSAAKALSAHFDQVTVLDRDALPEEPAPRPGTPQARHAHALLAGGEQALGKLFPRIAEDLERAGAVKMRTGLDLRFERPGYDPFPKRDLGFDMISLSRPLLEFVIRGRAGQEANIAVRSRCRVTEFLASPDRAAVSGLRFEDADGSNETIETDLVVDASGRAVLTSALLDRIGFAKPDETEIGIDQGYSTAIFDIPEQASRDWTGLTHLPSAPESSRGAFILPMENGRWIVSFGGNHDDAPPADTESFLAFAKGLRTSTVYNAIENAKRVAGIVRYSLPCSVRRHFEKLTRFPRGLIPVGDAVCRFNPVFGQGMSVAAQEAAVLDRLLGERTEASDPLDGLAPVFFADIQALLEAPWATAVTDFVYPKTRGDRPADFQKRVQYGLGLVRLAAEDPEVHKLVAEVNNLIRPQSALREPELRSRVLGLMSA